MHRRDVLRAGIAAAIGACAATSPDEAGAAEPRLRGAELTPLGTTFDLAPKAAPYPAPGRPWADSTVLAFVPRGYRVPRTGSVDVVTFFHGHATTAREAIVRHQLREQLVESRQNAVLVVPQGPVHAANGDFGRVADRNGLARLLDEVRALCSSRAAEKALPAEAMRGAKRVGRVIVAGHSGGYRAAAAVLGGAGVDVRETWLFDALYGETATFARWVAAAPRGRKLISLAIAGEPLRHNRELAELLEARGIEVAHDLPNARLSRAEMVHARAIVGRQVATHGTATFEESSLRDCLVASCLLGRGSDAFFEDADAPRTIARRPPRKPS